MTETTPAYVEVLGLWPETDVQVKFLLRGNICSDGRVYWNVDELLQHLTGNGKLRVARWFQREGRGFLESIGGHNSDHYCRSHLAARQSPVEGERSFQEFSLSTLGVLRLCLWWVAGRSTQTSRNRAEPMLRFLLSAWLQLHDFSTIPLTFPEHISEQCHHKHQGGMCLHLHSVISTMSNSTVEPQLRQTQLLYAFLNYECLACRAAATTEVERLASCVNTRAIAGVFPTDAALSVNAYVTRGRKRRMDAHVRSQALGGNDEKRTRTKIGMQLFVPRARQLVWESENLRGLMSAGLRAFESLFSASVAFDASRMSKPSEETIAFLFQDCTSRVSTWLPVQRQTSKLGVSHGWTEL
eukprot:6492803-Amphidinium_carterae.2